MTLHKYIIIRSDCTELTALDLCLRDWSDQYLHFFRLGYELSYGWLEAPQAHVSSMRATRLLYLSSPDVEEGVHFSLRHAQKSIHFNRTHIPQPPFPFHQTFHIFSLLHSPNTMIHGVHPFSPSPDQTYCVFRGVSGTWRVVVLCTR